MQTLDFHFSAFDSVGAFRAAPERTYLYTGEAPVNVGRYGENFAQMLASSASSRGRAAYVSRQVASWFGEAGIARDVRIKPLTNRHFELIVEDNTGLKNNITDSGFGCSQVLPVLVGGYSLLQSRVRARPPIFVVQEPEIHLHPTAAAHLGTYFTQLARSGVQCFVETHSENIVLRIARHVALGHLNPEDVRIYWVSGEGAAHGVSLLQLRPDGTFATDWPAGFFPTRASETMSLARAASGISDTDPLSGLFS
jgi:predicted ATPase